MAGKEETRAPAEALESLQRADDPDRSPSGKDEYFQGSGLWDNILQAQAKRKNQSHPAIQQPVADALTSASVSVPITVVPSAKVLASNMSNLASRPGSPNPLKVAIEGDRLPAGLKQKKLPSPPDACRVLTELPSDTRAKKLEPLTADSNSADDQPQPMMVAVHISAESDFTANLYQIIPSAPQYSLPL